VKRTVNFKEVAKRIANEKENMATYITEEQVRKYPEQLGHISSVLHEERVKLIGLYEELLQIDMEAALEKITQWGRETGAFCSEMGMTIDKALDELNYYREKMTDIIFDAADTKCHDLKIYHKAVLKLQRIIDQAAQSFSIAFVNHHNEMMNKARREIAELPL
jgi:rsbT co-antagonist protein RsbR